MSLRHHTLIIAPGFERLLLATALAGASAWAGVGLAVILGVPGASVLFVPLAVPMPLAAGLAVARRKAVSRVLLAGSATVAGGVLLLWFARYPAFALLAAGAVIGAVTPDARTSVQRVNGALALGLAAFAGFYVATAVGSTAVVRMVPPLLAYALLGALYGFLAGFGHLATHARWDRDRVELLFRAQQKHGAVPPLAVQALHLYRRIRETLPRDATAGPWADTQRAVARLVLQVLGLAAQSREMGEHLALSDVDDLTRRQQAMRDAAAGAEDVAARRHYAGTAAVLQQRLGRLHEFGHRRERIEALCHHCLSVLENLRLALAQARLTGHGTRLDEVTSALTRLNALQSELDCTAEALRELEPDPSPPQSPPAGPVAPEPAR